MNKNALMVGIVKNGFPDYPKGKSVTFVYADVTKLYVKLLGMNRIVDINKIDQIMKVIMKAKTEFTILSSIPAMLSIIAILYIIIERILA